MTENLKEESNKQTASTNQPQTKVSYKNMLRGFALAAIVSGYIIGPLLILGGLGWWLDKQYDVGKLVVVLFILVAFVISNALIIIRSKKMIQNFSKKTGTEDKPNKDLENN